MTAADDLIALHELPAHLPASGGGRRVSVRTLRNWVVVGIRLPTGETVKLKTVKIGRRRAVRVGDLARFIEQLNPP